jgi:hypothetical protein
MNYVPQSHRMEIFKALVELQDRHDMPVPQSRSVIAKRFGINEAVVKQIEEEGLAGDWPPLSSS